MPANKRLTVSIVLTALLAAVFWSQSRVPALNEKAQMGLRTQFDEISFEILLPVSQTQGLLERVLRTDVNWLYTNWQGMTFGLLFAAAALTILGCVQRRSFAKPWLNTLSGVAFGAPLGVCVNCATPIAQGLYAAGARLETALATLIASPTLNVIVLTMSFTLLPTELALAKLGGVALVLLSLSYLVRRFASQAPDAAAGQLPPSRAALALAQISTNAAPSAPESYLDAAKDTLRRYVRYLLYIVKVALPLMLLAGLLGAFVIEVVPFDLFAGAAGPWVVVGSAMVATVLPVPMAFDVIAVSALLASGVQIGPAIAILFALGIYSVYPAAVIARYISIRLSLAIAVLVAGLSIVLGLASQAYFAQQQAGEREVIALGIAAAGQNAYAAAVGICNGLPRDLQEDCFAQHIDAFSELVPRTQLCETRPEALSTQACAALLTSTGVRQLALASADITICADLGSGVPRAQCEFDVAVQTAVQDHDIGRCDGLGTLADDCRTLYLNASLLFNPDDSVCRGLAGQELSDCTINAAIYRYADTMDFSGCEAFAAEDAREYCRYVIASSMIGRRDDASGCTRLATPELAARCASLVTAWRAEREVAPELCEQLSTDLRSACVLRVAGKAIDASLARHALAASGAGSVSPNAANARAFPATASSLPPEIEWSTVQSDAALDVTFTAHRARTSNGSPGFRSAQAATLGIAHSWNFRLTDFFEPFIIGKGIASGDFNADAWPDLVLATESGAALYRNVGGTFQLAALDQHELANENLFLVALVDADNDGRQDLFASAYGGRNYLLLNLDGEFTRTELVGLEGNRRLSMAAGFADLDRNGELDMVFGNWSSGVEKLFAPEMSGNEIWYRRNGSYDAVALEEAVGETNSILLADIDGDGLTDLLTGNDRIVPDTYYLGRADGGLAAVRADSGFIPLTSMFTMSLDAADFNNDLRTDLFSTDMTFVRSSRDDYCASVQGATERGRCRTLISAYDVFRSGSALQCRASTANDRHDCFLAFSIKAAKNLKDPSYCENLPGENVALSSLCRHLALPIPPEAAIDQRAALPQVQRNTLLLNEGASFSENAETFGAAASYWSWNAKAADLDNDGWQDIYVGNGFHFGDSFHEIHANVMFRNLQGRGFEQVQEDWGLADTINTPSYTYLDFDLDGDLDIVATGVLSAPRVFVNELAGGNAISIALTDERGNSDAIGARVTIRYGGAERLAQQRQIKLSGGFMSFDHARANFGLGAHSSIDTLEVRWPDGETTVHDGPLPAARTYRVRRR